MEYGRYWFLIFSRAWEEAWGLVVQHSPRALLRNAIIFIIACVAFYYFQPNLVALKLSSPENLSDTLAWAIMMLVVIIVLFSAVFILETIFIVPYQIWKELEAIKKRSESSIDDISRFQSGEWRIAYPSRHDDHPNWTIRELFYYIRPDLAEDAEAKEWEVVGDELLDKLSTGQLDAWGRFESSSSKKAGALTKIPQGFWEDADWTYWFLAEGHDRLVHAKRFSGLGFEEYRDIQVNRSQAMRLWHKKSDDEQTKAQG